MVHHSLCVRDGEGRLGLNSVFTDEALLDMIEMAD